jgi:flavin-binding protein dodecin
VGESRKGCRRLGGQSLRDLRVAEVVEQDMVLKDGKVEAYRARVKISFKFEGKG